MKLSGKISGAMLITALLLGGCGSDNDHDAPAPGPQIDPAVWSTPTLFTGDYLKSNGLNIKFNDAGQGAAVWIEESDTGPNDRAMMARLFDGDEWGDPAKVGTCNDNHNTDHPGIEIAPDGKVLVVWGFYDGTRYDVWSAHFDGSAWTPAQKIETEDLGSARVPALAMDAQGRALAVWGQKDASYINAWCNYFDGTAWSGAVKLENEDTTYMLRVRVDMNDAGQALAVWCMDTSGVLNVWANRFDGTAWAGAVRLQTATSACGSSPLPVIYPDGTSMVFWNQQEGGKYSVWADSFDGTKWLGATRLGAEADGAYKRAPLIDSAGKIIMVWTSRDGSTDNIRYNSFTQGGWLGEETLQADANDPQMALDSTGAPVCVFTQNDDGRAKAFLTRLDESGWSSPLPAVEFETGDVSLQDVFIDKNDTITISGNRELPQERTSFIKRVHMDGTGPAPDLFHTDPWADAPNLVPTHDDGLLAWWNVDQDITSKFFITLLL